VGKKFAAAFTVDKIGEFIVNAIESAAALDRLSQESGVAVEELSALAAVFAQSGVGQDEMASSLKKLNQAISDAAGNATSKAAFAFQALGLSVTNSNGSLKTAGELLPQIADAYSRLADGPNKVAINIALLGKNANALIPTLDQGAQGLAKLQAEAVASGAALSGELAEAAEALEKKFNALKQSVTGSVSTQTLEALLPTLTALVDGMKNIGASATPTNAALGLLNGVLQDLGGFALDVQSDFKQVGNVLSGVKDSAVAAADGFRQAFSAGFSFDAWVSSLSATAKRVLGIYVDTGNQAVAINEAGNKALEGVYTAGSHSIEAIMDETLKMVETKTNAMFAGFSQGDSIAFLAQLTAGKTKVEDFAAALKVQTDSFGKGVAAQTLLKLSTGQLGDAVAAAQKELEDLKAKGIDPLTDAAGKAASATIKAADAAKALSVQQQAQIDIKEIKDYIDKLQEQVDKTNLGTLAAQKYAETHGKLGLALKDSAVDGAGFTKQIDDLTKKLIATENEKSLTDLSVQALELRGHLVEAADAAFALQSKLQLANAGSVKNTALEDQIADTHALTVAQKAFAEQVNLTAQIRADEALQESVINSQIASGQTTELAGQKQISDARIAELGQLTDIEAKMQQIANSSGIPALVIQAKQAQASINDLAASTNALANKLRNDVEESASDAFAAFVTGTESASQAFHQFLSSIETEIVKIATKNLLESLLGGGGGGGGDGGFFTALASILGGGGAAAGAGGAAAGAGAVAGGVGEDAFSTLAGLGFASGGDVSAGQRITVGEHGAEEFVPSVNGTIVPNGKISKGDTHIHFTINAPTGTISRQTQSQIAAAAARGVNDANRRHL
jgi:hypothetical protein